MLIKKTTFEGKTFLDASSDYLQSQGVPDSDIRNAIVSERWEGVRSDRDRLIADADWTQMPDSPLSTEQKAAWAEYRQALRDIPDVYDDPDAVVWPDQPA